MIFGLLENINDTKSVYQTSSKRKCQFSSDEGGMIRWNDGEVYLFRDMGGGVLV